MNKQRGKLFSPHRIHLFVYEQIAFCPSSIKESSLVSSLLLSSKLLLKVSPSRSHLADRG